MVEIVKKTFEERVKMYMKSPKKMLAEMLAARDELDFPQKENEG